MPGPRAQPGANPRRRMEYHARGGETPAPDPTETTEMTRRRTEIDARVPGRSGPRPGTPPPRAAGWMAPGAALLAALALALPGPATAQQPADTASGGLAARDSDGPRMVDRVVAVVGDTTVLLSEVQQEVFRMRRQGLQLPSDPFARDSLLRSVLDRLVEQTMLLQEAKRSGVQVNEERVRQLADDRFSRIRSDFDSDQAMRQAVESGGQNMFQFREMLRAQARADLVLNRFRQQLTQGGDLPPATVTEDEIRTFFQQNAAGQRRAGSISFDRVMVAPEPDSARADSARAVAQQALDEIRDGTQFAVAARRHSDDSGSRDEGGDLGWIRRGDVVPTFGDAAWAAPPGRAVGPVRSRLGYHVLKVENVRGGERHVRHILVRPTIDSTDVQDARERAAALADSLREGADADRLAREYGLSGEQVRFDQVRLDQITGTLGEAYSRAISSPSPGDVLGPFEVQSSEGGTIYALLEVREFTPTGEYRLEDVRDQIRSRLLQQKQFDKYITQLRDRMYVRLLI